MNPNPRVSRALRATLLVAAAALLGVPLALGGGSIARADDASGSTVAVAAGAASPVPGLTSGGLSGTVRVLLRTSGADATLALGTTTGLTGIPGTDNAAALSAAGRMIGLVGTASAVDSALATLTVTAPTAQSITMWRSNGSAYLPIVRNDAVDFEYVGHVATPLTWADALAAAAQPRTVDGVAVTGFLATPATAVENQYVKSTHPNTVSWIGATDQAAEGEWRWAAGPLTGQQFWSGSGATGHAVNDAYIDWGGTQYEPNGGTSENCMNYWVSSNYPYDWNDWSCTSTASYDWEAIATAPLGGSTSSVAVTPVAAPSGLTVANVSHSAVALTWNAPAAPAGAIADYRVESSTDGQNWTAWSHTASSTTAATVTGLTDGTAYSFRVAAVLASGATTPASDPVSATPTGLPHSDGVPVISGTAAAGTGLTAASSGWTAAGLPITGEVLQWQSSPDGATWTAIPGAGENSYTPARSDIGLRLRVVDTATSASGSVQAVSAPTAPVLPAGASAPTSVVVMPSSTGYMVDWHAPVDDGGAPIADYVLSWSTDGATWSSLTTTALGAAIPATTGIADALPLQVRVLARNGVDGAVATGVGNRPAPAPPRPVTGTGSTATGSNGTGSKGTSTTTRASSPVSSSSAAVVSAPAAATTATSSDAVATALSGAASAASDAASTGSGTRSSGSARTVRDRAIESSTTMWWWCLTAIPLLALLLFWLAWRRRRRDEENAG